MRAAVLRTIIKEHFETILTLELNPVWILSRISSESPLGEPDPLQMGVLMVQFLSRPSLCSVVTPMYLKVEDSSE